MGKKERRYCALKKGFPSQLVPAEWKKNSSTKIREPAAESFNERKKVGRPARKRPLDLATSSTSDSSVAAKRCKVFGSSVMQSEEYRKVMNDFATAMKEVL